MPALRKAVADTNAATDTLRQKGKATEKTIEAMIGTLSELLPFGQVANVMIGEITAAVASRFGDTLVELSVKLTGRPVSQLGGSTISRVIQDIPEAITRATTKIHDAVVRP